jgi:hypothetical protein
MPTAAQLVGLLADPARLRVVSALVLEPGTRQEVASRAAVSLRDAVDAVARLADAGLVEEGGDGTLVVVEALFGAVARAEAPPPRPTEHPDAPPDRRAVLDRFFRDGTLRELPTKRSVRLVVLDEIAQRFEPGVRYPEREVNGMLRQLHPDTAALRRYLVDERFLERAGGEYWRAGGTVDV